MENTEYPGKAQIIPFSHLNLMRHLSSVSERMYQSKQLGLYKGVRYSESFVVFNFLSVLVNFHNIDYTVCIIL